MVHRTDAHDESFDFNNNEYDKCLITPVTDDGFRVGDDDRVNKDGITYHYVCWRDSAGVQQFGSYMGNGFDNREITGLGFRPEYVMVNCVTEGREMVHHPASLGEEVDIPEWMVEKGGDVLGFRVQGESMKDAYIQDGDVVIVKRAASAEPGEMVVALLEDSSITLKRLKKEKEKYSLITENTEYESIFEPFQLVGKVIGVLRRYR